jgi:pilus assembly protein Flp/PilA
MATTLMRILRSARAWARDEHGQSMIEYGLIAALIAVAAVVALTGLGHSLAGMFTNIGGDLP